jgi:two-component system KDP operon response regulator KdpE
MIEPSPSVLIIEDDPQTRRFLKAGLSGRGWGIHEAESGVKGLTKVKAEPPDLAIVDLGLPDIDGVSLVRSLRLVSDMPILILSARSQERDKIEALDAGADDYLTKPFSTGELDARLRALLRRVAKINAKAEVLALGSLKIDLLRRKVFKADAEVNLTPIEYRLLALLVRQLGLVVTHRHILKEIWGPEHVHDSHYLRIYMGQLRHKLEDDPARPRYLLTEVGVGYRLCGEEIL